MTKIYALTEGEYSDYHVVGLFSTKEIAEAVIGGDDRGGYSIEEYELDAMACERICDRYCCGILVNTGEFYGEYQERGFAQPDKCLIKVWPQCYGYGARIWVESPFSAEHARKVAIEQRQKYVREHSQ